MTWLADLQRSATKVNNLVKWIVSGVVVVLALGCLLSIALPEFSDRPTDLSRALHSNLSYGKQIVIACRIYASENEGEFPPSLEALIPDYLTKEDWEKLRKVKMTRSAPDESWSYFSGLAENSPQNLPIISSPLIDNARRVIARVNGSATVVRESEFKDLLAIYRAQQGAAPNP